MNIYSPIKHLRDEILLIQPYEKFHNFVDHDFSDVCLDNLNISDLIIQSLKSISTNIHNSLVIIPIYYSRDKNYNKLCHSYIPTTEETNSISFTECYNRYYMYSTVKDDKLIITSSSRTTSYIIRNSKFLFVRESGWNINGYTLEELSINRDIEIIRNYTIIPGKVEYIIPLYLIPDLVQY